MYIVTSNKIVSFQSTKIDSFRAIYINIHIALINIKLCGATSIYNYVLSHKIIYIIFIEMDSSDIEVKLFSLSKHNVRINPPIMCECL